jgi:uncharacterized protein (TIGR03437 family)
VGQGRYPRLLLSAVCLTAALAFGAESHALGISANIQAKHVPFGAILDPVYASSASNQIVGYSRCGDSALWTGAYLAAESFRYKVTQSPDALKNVRSALAALKGLADVTGDNRLARCMVPADSPYAAGIASEEAHNTIIQMPPWIWVDHTSRDHVVGVFFGLGVAFDIVDDPRVKSGVSDLATRLISYISRHIWSPGDDITTTFQTRPEELQMLIEVARHVNPANQVSGPLFMLPMRSAVFVDVQSRESYFKFNLDYMSLYHLVRLRNGDNLDVYEIVRDYTAQHQNAFFNMIDRALRGPDAARDAETRTLLEQWLLRPQRDFYVDLSSAVKVCGSEACEVVPVALRPPADFLWQRNPYQLAGGSGLLEGAGIDYILPYWMARYYGVIAASPVQSSAAPSNAVSPDSLASLYGSNLAPMTAQAASQPLPLTLGGVTLTVTDSAGSIRMAPLHYVSPTQINLLIPADAAPGPAKFTVANGASTQEFTGTVDTIAPRLYTMSGTGTGIAAATAIMVQAANPQLQTPVTVFRCTQAGCVSVPISLGVDTPVYVTFYGTGFRGRSSLAQVSVTINGISVPVLYAGVSPSYAGLDQVNVALSLALRGSAETDVVLTVDGQNSNVVKINIQ